jgi:hypothetical protein
MKIDVIQKGYWNGKVGDVILQNRTTERKALSDAIEYATEHGLSTVEVIPFERLEVNLIQDEVDIPDLTPTIPVKAFPTAVGYGRNSVGGRGGRIIKVTSLADSGPGTLREAIESTGPRIVLFEVGGLITVNSALEITDSNISILGQSAPGDGIAITAEGTPNIPVFRIKTNEVIIRYIKVRRSSSRVSETSSDGIYIESGNNIIIDHCSMALASDENLAIANYTGVGTSNITIQYCIISNPYGGSSKGALCVSAINTLTFYKNAFITNNQRNPLISTQTSTPTFNPTFEIINNVIYNGKYQITVGRDNPVMTGIPKFNIINNMSILRAGINQERRMVLSTTDEPMEIYVKGNISKLRPTITDPTDWDEEWATTQGVDGVGGINTPAMTSNQIFAPHSTPIIEDMVFIEDAADVWSKIKDTVGASYPLRDSLDLKLVSDVNLGVRTTDALAEPIPTYDNFNNTTPSYTDSNNDGIDDIWFTANVPSGVNANDISPTGYTWFEEYINQLTN